VHQYRCTYSSAPVPLYIQQCTGTSVHCIQQYTSTAVHSIQKVSDFNAGSHRLYSELVRGYVTPYLWELCPPLFPAIQAFVNMYISVVLKM
jgi:hypothetical protein